MSRSLVCLAAVLGLLAVGTGAMGSHGLRTLIDTRQMGWFATAAEYQMYHALALLGVGLWAGQAGTSRTLYLAAGALLAGIVLFCGSLYAMALGGPRWLAWLTPTGGFCFLLGWGALAWSAWFDPARATPD